jgi:hypothetical protein
MTVKPTDDVPGFVASEPERYHDCCRLICPGQGYFLAIEQAVVCPDCVRTTEAIRLSGGLAVEVGVDRFLVRLRWDRGCCRSTRAGGPSPVFCRGLALPPRAILYGLGQVRCLDFVAPCQVGNGAGQLEDAVIGPGAPWRVGRDKHLELVHGRTEEALPPVVDLA